jgi:hypothetical protein
LLKNKKFVRASCFVQEAWGKLTLPLDSVLKHCRTINILAWDAESVNKYIHDPFDTSREKSVSRRGMRVSEENNIVKIIFFSAEKSRDIFSFSREKARVTARARPGAAKA